MRLAFIWLLVPISFAQDIQINSTYLMKMIVPYVGPVELTTNQIVASGFFRSSEKVDAKKWIVSQFLDEERGNIFIEGVKNILSYNKEDEEYWIESPEDFFSSSDSRKKEKGFIKFLFLETDKISKEDNKITNKIERIEDDRFITVNGFRTKKWITTIFMTEDKKVIFEEWCVDTLPLLVIIDSLKEDITEKFNPYQDSKRIDESEFDPFLSSELFIRMMETDIYVKPIKGHPVKMNMTIYKNKGEVFSIGFEMLELYASPFDASSFSIPEKFKRIKIN